MRTVDDIFKNVKKTGECGSCLQKLCHFFFQRRKNAEEARMFEKINHIPWIKRFRFTKAKKRIDSSYAQHLQNLQKAAKHRKIHVAFLVNEISKWHCDTLYDLLENSNHFEPLILVTKRVTCYDTAEEFNATVSFFKSADVHVECAYDAIEHKYLDLKIFSPDIVFYEQPWSFEYIQSVTAVANFALTCYTPYCFHMMCSEYNYLELFHRFLWKYFVESPWHLESYKGRFKAGNCISSGSLHLDKYFSKKVPNVDFWKDASPAKKIIIYAPHFTFTTQHRVATFPQNGQFMLNLADMYPQTTWVLRPHPSFDQSVVADGIMTQQELDEYYAAWEKYGTIIRGGDYFDLVKTSDCLITDCISFLADYFPSGKPVFHLRRSDQSREFNDFGKDIIGTYYQIYSNAELEKLFSRVMIDGDDFMASQRLEQMEKLQLLSDETASKRVFDHLQKELKIQ
ncbi:MAG: CDP-glycerol glycerophosphotransferase family protein [Puniceicoccales bacterium]|jgi:hypothetical protein|nr:CDP-glycerol glycerophosphotransferase family protein [Puniceicoccales bacterium]